MISELISVVYRVYLLEARLESHWDSKWEDRVYGIKYDSNGKYLSMQIQKKTYDFLNYGVKEQE